MSILKEKKFWVGFIVSVFFLWLFLRNINFRELWNALVHAHYLYLIPATFFLIISFYFRAWRWQIFLRGTKKVTVQRLMSPMMIGFMGNSVLPFRLGEIVRGYMLTREENINLSLGLATIAVERIFDGLCLLFLFVAVILIFPINLNVAGVGMISSGQVKTAGFGLLTVCLGLLVGMLILRFFSVKCLAIAGKLFAKANPKTREKILHIIHQFAEGLEVLRDWKGILLTTFQSFGVWLFLAVSVYFIQSVFDLQHLPFYAPVFIMTVVAFGVSVPSTPGYVGPYDAACQYAVRALGGGINVASGFTIVLHLSQIIPVVIMGFYFLWKQNLSLKQLREIKE
jgi:glycosyltransferase 2 family protein